MNKIEVNEKTLREWINALQSGKYKKGKTFLKQKIRGNEYFNYDALGILAEIHGLKSELSRSEPSQDIYEYPEFDKVFPYRDIIIKKQYLEELYPPILNFMQGKIIRRFYTVGQRYHQIFTLSSLNDDYCTFDFLIWLLERVIEGKADFD